MKKLTLQKSKSVSSDKNLETNDEGVDSKSTKYKKKKILL